MPLDKNDWMWLASFSSGAVKVPASKAPDPGSDDDIRLRLEAVQNKEYADAQARKQVMLAAANARLEAQKEAMRKAFQIETKVYASKDGAAREAAGKSAKTKTLKTRDDEGDQRNALDTKHHAGQIQRGGTQDQMARSHTLMAMIVRETDELAKAKTNHSSLDEKTKQIKTEPVDLFTAKEISDEIYTPMVREKIIGENFVPNKYSATQRMLDGSSEHYIEECKKNGTRLGVNKAELTKGAITLARDTTTTVLSALAPVESGQHAIAGTGKLSKEMAARSTEITKGIAALLTATVDAGSAISEYKGSASFSETNFKKVMNGIGSGIGRIVAGSLGDNNLGLAIADGISAGANAIAMGPRLVKWAKSNEPFPWSALIDDLGSAIESGINVKGDLASGDEGKKLGIAAPMIAGGFKILAKAAERNAVTAIRNGDWKTVFGILTTAGVQSAQRIPTALVYSPDYNAKDEFADQIEEMENAETRNSFVEDGADALGEAAPELAEKATSLPGGRTLKRVAEAVADKTTTARGKKEEEFDKLFEEKQRKLDEQAELNDLNKRQQDEIAAYQTSLDCLGSSSPDDAKYKSIAVLIAQIETDRAIWTAVITISSGGIAVAQAFVPALKSAGELVKFVANIKAAADRLKALLDWRDAQKDATSAVSPYASSIENMIRNQTEQLSHYSIQAAANAIKALVAVGELSPYAPAFKVAGAAVGLAASTEELIYKAYKQTMLVRSWAKTQEALRNPDDRILGLMAREMNPTLAKYTIAYGALIEHDQVAITACGRIGLDRETLARTGDKVADVKNFMQTLYKDDNVVVGQLDVVKGRTKVPPATLTAKAWSVSHLLWSEKDRLAGPNPPEIVTALTRVGKFEAKNTKQDYSELSDAELESYMTVLTDLTLAFKAYRPVNDMGVGIEAVIDATELYAALAAARQEAIKDVIALRAVGTPLLATV